jgi:Domain of unknown function (DUF3127)
MEKTGTIIHILPLKTGEGKNGTWKKQDFVIETEEQFKKKICFQVWGDKMDTSRIVEGSKVTVSLDVESREYNGNWYSDIKAWKLDVLEAGASLGTADSFTPPSLTPDDFPAYSESSGDDLPF